MDRRIQKTQKAIRIAFLALLGKKSLSKITVAEISELAELGRGTFYLHYKDIYDLYEQVENDLYDEIEQLLDKSCAATDKAALMGLINALTEYIVKNRPTFLLLIGATSSSRNLYKLKKIFQKKIVEENPKLKKSQYDLIECMFITSGIIGVLEEWLLNKPKYSEKLIAESLFKIIELFD